MATVPGGSYITDTHSDQTLYGQHDGDFIVASDGHDVIYADTGSEYTETTRIYNHIFGGADTFVFNSRGGKDAVMDFHDGDIIQIQKNINNLHITTPADLVAHVSDANGSAVITLGSETITLVGIKAEDIHTNPSGSFTIH